MREYVGGITIKEYNKIHSWTRRKLSKTGKCFYCRKKARTHWSNIDHKYREDVTEWQEVCPSCHIKYDLLMLGRRSKRVTRLKTFKRLFREGKV